MTIEEFKNKYEKIKDSNIYKDYCSILENKDSHLRNVLKEKQELIDYLKKEINKINKEIEHYDLWHETGTDINFLILRKQMFKEILSKIEKK